MRLDYKKKERSWRPAIVESSCVMNEAYDLCTLNFISTKNYYVFFIICI